jgi:D-alanyl-D-alanine carboxypeptidase/D-alanyl-D-alanine-endopeptidase (penicillin-binding protein 4)
MIARWVAAMAVVALLGVGHVPHAAATTTRPLELPAPPTPPASAAPAPTPSPQLAGLLDQLQQFPQARPRGTVGLVVTGADGAVLAARQARRPLLPASTVKLVTAAAALRILGPGQRFVTRVYASRPPDDAGVIAGDLVVVGGGDPVLATPTYRRKVNMARPATSLRLLAARIARRGITQVRGRVVGDASILADRPMAAGWSADYLAALDTTRSSGLTVDAGLRLFRRSGQLRAAAAAEPARRTARELRRLLDGQGVQVAGAARVGTLPRDAVEVARVTSPPLIDLLAHMLRYSDNHIADGVFRMLGATTGDGTWRGGARAARAALWDADVDWRGLRLADGSGLSRQDRLSAAALVEVLRVMADGPDRARWLALLPVAGRTGTIAGRLTGTQAVGRVHAKTGTLRDVRALAGTVPGRTGPDRHIAVLANDLPAYADILAARRLADVVALAVVADEDGCRGPIRPPDDTARRRSPERRICGPGDEKRRR